MRRRRRCSKTANSASSLRLSRGIIRDTLSKPENIKFVREACREVTGKEIGIRILVKDPAAEGEPLSREDEERLEKQRLREMAENSPIVQQMLKTFRGEIVDVRRVDGER